jgi:crossover junction endodeoxyribonuclease RuvC
VRILGIDPGSHVTGWGVIEADGPRLRRVDSGVIRASGDALGVRLAAIHRDLEALIARLAPQAAALEAVFTHRNPRSALLLGHARGAALVACSLAGLAAAEYPPARVKAAVSGYGRADKLQVQQMVQRLLGLDARPRSDEADALAVAICHHVEGRFPAADRRGRGAGRTLRGVAKACVPRASR